MNKRKLNKYTNNNNMLDNQTGYLVSNKGIPYYENKSNGIYSGSPRITPRSYLEKVISQIGPTWPTVQLVVVKIIL